MATKTAELNETSSHEDIEAAVEQIASEVEADREGDSPKDQSPKGHSPKGHSPKGQETSDAQITSEHADNEKKPAADSPDGQEDTADDKDASEKTGKAETADEDWRKEAKAEASAYGISEKEIAEFQSREELDRALKLFDRNLDVERKKVLDEQDGEKSPEDKGGKTQKKPPEAESKDSDGTYKIGLDPVKWEDEIVKEFTRMRDHYESRLTAMEKSFTERFAAADAIAEEERFDRSVDALEFSQLFGKTGEESADELKRRNDLLGRLRIEQIVLSRMGRVVDYNALVQRVARSLFPDEYDKRLIKNHTRKVSRQSDKRQGGGATRATDPPESPRDEADRLYRAMEGV